jgi:mRNA interferase RelE/StbE
LKVFLSRKAAKALDETPPELRRRLDEKLSELSLKPFPTGCRKLRGAQNSYRIRVGDIRVLYTILTKDEILVFKIARRESAYN